MPSSPVVDDVSRQLSARQREQLARHDEAVRRIPAPEARARYKGRRAELFAVRTFGTQHYAHVVRLKAKRASDRPLTPEERAVIDHHDRYLAVPPSQKIRRNLGDRTSLYLGAPRKLREFVRGFGQPRATARRRTPRSAFTSRRVGTASSGSSRPRSSDDDDSDPLGSSPSLVREGAR